MRTADAGFTLIEALVAMTVLAVSSVALLAAVETHISRISALNDRTIARWVAQDQLTALRLGIPREEAVVQAGLPWRIAQLNTPTSDPDLQQVTISVYRADENDHLVSLTGFIDLEAAK